MNKTEAGQDYIYEYKGYYYMTEEEIEPMENHKTFHEVYVMGPDGGLHYNFGLPMSPYTRRVSEELFRRWIDMGRPSREQMGGHHVKDHVRYYEKWLDDQIDKELLGD